MKPQGALGCLVLLPVAAAVVLLLGRSAAAAEMEMRGIWMHATQIQTRAEADQCVARIDAANLNAVFLLVWYWGGQAFYRSDLCSMGEGVEEGYDPLGYMVQECHKRNIEVHAWFVNGSYGATTPRHVLDKHPDWAVQTGGGGQLWYDFGKPEVRTFQSDLMVECLRRYDLDGIHFDYIRYGPRVCLCKHCQGEFAKRYGYEPLTGERAASLPVVAVVSSNPVAEPTTATVIAQFDNGLPAMAVNTVEKGHVVLVNWHAEREAPPAVSEILRRALQRWRAPRDQAVVMDTEPNRAKYGRRSTAAGAQWLQRLGWKAKIVREDRLAKLPQGSTLVLSCVYLIPDDTAKGIERFVRAGGSLLVIDGPVLSIRNPSIQRVLGMKGKAGYFSGTEVIRSTGKSDLVPTSDREIDIEKEKLRGEKWREFRAWGVTELVRDVYRRAKKAKPQAQVTAAVFTPLASAKRACQDWPGWLREGIIDYVIPMAYTTSNETLTTQLQEWKTVDPGLERIVPGLSIYQRTKGRAVTRDTELILSQRKLCMDNGARGSNYFSLHYLSDPLIEALTSGPHKGEVKAYRPPPRNE